MNTPRILEITQLENNLRKSKTSQLLLEGINSQEYKHRPLLALFSSSLLVF